jgi:mRNA interferase MazF
MKNKEIDLSASDVVVLDFPGVKQTKRRPAVILSSTFYHGQRPDIIAGVITSQVDDATSLTDYVLRDWAQARLLRRSAFRAFLVTLPRSVIKRKIGKLSDRDWQSVFERIQRSFGLRQGH